MKFITTSVFIFICSIVFAQKGTSAGNQDVELGAVEWLRDYNEAIERAESQNKSMLILFQEVPGAQLAGIMDKMC